MVTCLAPDRDGDPEHAIEAPYACGITYRARLRISHPEAETVEAIIRRSDCASCLSDRVFGPERSRGRMR